MGIETIDLGLQIAIPTAGTKNWATQIKTGAWEPISRHDHSGGVNGSQIGASALADNSVGKAALSKNLALHQFVVTGVTGSNPTVSIDWDNGNIQTIDFETADGTAVFNLSNPIVDGGARYTFLLTQGATPLTDITWPGEATHPTINAGDPGSIKWPQGQKPILSTAADEIDKIELYYDGTNYFADWNVNYK